MANSSIAIVALSNSNNATSSVSGMRERSQISANRIPDTIMVSSTGYFDLFSIIETDEAEECCSNIADWS